MRSSELETEEKRSDPSTVQPSDETSPFHARFLWSLVGLVAIPLWIRPLTASLWLDETITWWIVKGGFGQAIDRAETYQGQSPAYFAFEWLVRSLGGRNEIVLRLPSVIAAAATAYLLYLLAKRMLDVELARLTALLFVAWPGIVFASSDARPYALAVLAVVASTLALIRWLDSARVWYAIAYVGLGSSVIYAHYLFGIVFIPHLIYALVRLRDGSTRLRPKDVLIVGAGIVVATAPLIPQLLSLWGRRSVLTAEAPVTVSWLTELLLPPAALGALTLGGLAARATGSISIEPRPLGRANTVLVISWLIVPLAVLMGISFFSPVQFLSLRYTLMAAPAGALAVAWVIRSVREASARRVIAAAFAILSVLAVSGALKTEDWRGAAASVQMLADEHSVVLVQPGLLESTQLDWFDDPENRSYLLAPLSYYPMPGRIELLPYGLNAQSERFLIDRLGQFETGAARIVIVTRYPDSPFRSWLEGRLGVAGWKSSLIGQFGTVEVVSFTR